MACSCKLLRLFVIGVLAAPRAVLLELEARLELLLVLKTVVVRALARFTFQFDEIILGHNN